MRLEKMFCVGFAMAMLAGCNNEELLTTNSENTSQPSSGDAYLALSLSMVNGANTRASSTENAGTAEEWTVQNARVVLFNDSLDSAKVVNVIDLAFNASPSNVANLVSDAFPVDSTAKFVLVLANPVQPFKDRIVRGVRLATIKETFVLEDSDIASMSKTKEFFMNNVKLVDCSGFIVKYDSSNPSTTTGNLKEEAKKKPVLVEVDRAVAKVSLTTPSKKTSFDNENAKISLIKWRINVTNRKFNLLPDTAQLHLGSKPIYYKDANYSNNLTLGAGYFKEFKVDNEFVTYTGVKPGGEELYCIENTMQANQQKYAYTTQVVLQVRYLPKKDIEGNEITNSWFRYEGRVYTLEQLKKAYKESVNTNPGLIAACSDFAEKAVGNNILFDDIQAGMLNDTIASKVGNSEIEYFHEGLCYYKIMIRHDQDNNQLMSLGRYGVVRNNWYNLNVKSINEPGLPYPKDPVLVLNPDGSEDITDLDNTDDDAQNYISVDIQVKPWTKWNQDVEL